MVKISKDSLIRIIAFSTAAVIALSVLAYRSYREATVARRSLQHSYLRSVGDLSLNLDNIKNTLNKGLYSNNPDMMTELSAKLWSDANIAKISLSQLPIEELNLENTYKFLSQVGNYSRALSEKLARGEVITDEEKANLESLYDYARTISDSMWSVESQIHGGYLTFDKVQGTVLGANTVDNAESPQHVVSGFADIESNFESFPMLIYDGPFSDHLMERNPRMLKGAQAIDEATALKRAVDISRIADLRLVGEERGHMPSYTFMDGDTTVSITKNGGYLSYMLTFREVGDAAVSVARAIDNAKKFLATLGITEITDTYYELQHGVCIINFAGTQGGVTLYTDLIKVGVAMDNGDVLSFDSRGYLTNHMKRVIPEAQLTREQAKELLSPYLTVKDSKLCVIPSDGLSEKFCYEFLCTAKDGQQILVYINTVTGREEQLLILQISDNGMLTV
ncbi:MAG: germination protein YpeB [Oscillospiraceae bacterium]|nr:germination protein YpeB [Oscillospiraceae bacterium]